MILITRLAIGLALLAYLPGLLEQFESPKAAVVRVLGGGLLAAALAGLLSRDRPGSVRADRPAAARGAAPRWHVLDLCVCAWLVIESLSTWTSVAPTISVFGDRAQQEGLLTSIGLAGIYSGARLGTAGAGEARRLLLSTIGAIAIACCVGFWQLASFGDADWSNAAVYEGWHRPFGTLGHANLLGAVGAAALVAAVGLALTGSLGPWWATTAVVVFGAATALSLSRAAWIATGIGACAALALARAARGPAPATPRRAPGNHRDARGRLLPAGGIVVALALLMLIPPLRGRALELFAFGGGSGRARLEIWKAALAMWRAHPWLGAGPDTFHLLFDRYQTPGYWLYEWRTTPFHAHSIYLYALATRGIVGGVVAAIVLVATAFATRGAWRSGPAARALVPAIVGLLAVMGVAGGFGAMGIGGAAVAAGLLGTLTGLASSAESEPKRTARERRPARALAPVVAGAAVGAALLIPTALQLAGSRAAYRSEQSDRSPLAIPLALEGGRRAPWSDVLAANAADVLRRHATLTPDPPRAYALAESCARRAIALAPQRLYNQSELALILLLRARLGVSGADRQALAAIERCRELGPLNTSPLVHFSQVALLTGRADLVPGVIARAIDLYPREALPHMILGEAELALGDSAAAAGAIEQSLGLEWRGDEARRERAAGLLASLRH